MRRAKPPEPVPSPEYQVSGDDDGPLPARPDQMEALQQLSDVLNKLPDHRGIVEELTVDDVQRMLKSLSIPYRESYCGA